MKIQFVMNSIDDVELFLGVMRQYNVKGFILTKDGARLPVTCFMVLLTLISEDILTLTVEKSSTTSETITKELETILIKD